ncbi:MAG: hypothetical protein JNJ73_13800 [Hyphomonadaceae bacterium]|nr:hypothetical protein [Hyphomonadaceae bacterium]
MTDQSSGELTLRGAAFDVFRNRGRSGVLLGAAVGYLVIVLVVFGAFGLVFARSIGDYFTWAMQMSGDPSAVTMPPASVMTLIPGYILLLLVIYIVLAAYEAAVLRWLVRGETGGFLGFTLGADTWRIYFGYWIWFFVLIGLYVGVFLVAFIAGFAGAQADPGLAAIAGVLAGIIGLCAFLWIGIRLAPASATTVALNRFAFFNAWTVTRGRFWSLFGSFFLLFVLYIVAICVISGLGTSLLLGGTLSRLASQGDKVDPAAAFAMLATPNMIIGMVVLYGAIIVVATVFWNGLLGVNARAAMVAKAEGRIS